MLVLYKNGHIYVDVKDSRERNLLRNTKGFESSGLVEESFGSFSVEEKGVYQLNTFLTPIKDQLEIHPSFKNWKEGLSQPPVVIRCNVVKSRIYPGKTKLPTEKLEKACRYFVKAAVNMDKYKNGHWDGYINLYHKVKREFLTGLLPSVVRVMEEAKIPYTIEYLYDTAPERKFDWTVGSDLVPDPDQVEAIKAAVEGKRGIIKAPTGYGKTAVLARSVVANFAVPTLFVANKKTLLDDAANAFIDGIDGVSASDVAQIKDGWFGDVKIVKDMKEAPPIRAPIVVATIQSLHARLGDKKTRGAMLDWLRNTCKLVMIDETQAIGTRTWDDVLSECHAPYRIALSATPRRNDGASIKIQAYSGPWLYSTTAEKQIEKGRLCELDIRYQVYDHKLHNENDRDVEYNDMYRFCIMENTERDMECVVKPTMEMLKEGRHVLVLIMRIEHGQVLRNLFVQEGLSEDEVKFIWGETSDKKREQAIKDFRAGKIKVMVGSVIFDAGVNVPIISGVVLGGAGNSDITHIQRIGRGARTVDYEAVLGYTPAFMKGNKEKVTLVYDVIDQNAKFFHKQSVNRYYNAQKEFGKSRVSIVGDDYRVLKKSSKRAKENTKQVDQLSAQLEMLREFSD